LSTALVAAQQHCLGGETRIREASVNGISQLTMKIAAAVMLVALGGLAGFALNPNHGDATTATKPPPVEVRTQVIRHTVRIHRKAKPAKQPPRPAAPPPSAAPSQVVAPAAPQPVVAARPVAPVAHAPIRTRTSGAGAGGGGEREHEESDD
jgi:hypothetical protein